MSRIRLRVPHTLVLLLTMIILAQILTWILPQGEFERVTNEEGREVVIAGSYERTSETHRLSPIAFLSAIPRGFEAAGDIIFFCFLVGGAFGVLRATGAIDAIIGFLLGTMGRWPGALIFGGIFMFGFGSSTIGMAEEYLPFVPVLVALCLGLGFDRMTAVGILCVGYGVGYGTAAFNPFTVVIAQGIAGLEPTSGMGYRLILFVPFLALGFHHVYSYARKVAADPSQSLMADLAIADSGERPEYPALNAMHGVVLGLVLISIVALVIGIQKHHWYLVEMGAMFVALSILISIIARMGPSRTASTFCEGAADLTTTALLIGFARTIQIVLDDGRVVDTIINGIASPLAELGAIPAAIGMFVFQSLCNFFIPSGSGQAFVTMPLMAPMASLVGVTRQVAVLAYQFGDGFTNIFVPTNAVLVGILSIAGVPLDRWFRFIAPFMIKVWILGAAALAIAVATGYS